MAYVKDCESWCSFAENQNSSAKAKYWEQSFLSSRFCMKAKLEILEQNKMTDAEKCANQNDAQKKQKPSEQNNESKIVEICSNESHAVCAEKPLDVCGRYLGVIDSMNYERAFVCHFLAGYYTSVSVMGMILHFDEQEGGNVACHTVAPGFNYDWRNGGPTKTNTFLCSHTLAYVWRHRDMHEYRISGFCLAKNDQEPFTFDLNTAVNAPFFLTEQSTYMMGKRWLCVKDEKEKHTECYDLLSFRVMNSSQFMYDRVIVPDERSVEAELSALAVPSYKVTQREGYPLECVKCGKGTFQSMVYIDSSSRGLGRAYCVDCNIRFSVSDKRWSCARVVAKRWGETASIMLCEEALDTKFVCDRPHLRECEYTVERTYRDAGKEEQRSVSITLRLNKEVDVEEGG